MIKVPYSINVWLIIRHKLVTHLHHKTTPTTYMHMHAHTGRKDLLLVDSMLNFCNVPEPLRALNPSNGILDVPVTN